MARGWFTSHRLFCMLSPPLGVLFHLRLGFSSLLVSFNPSDQAPRKRSEQGMNFNPACMNLFCNSFYGPFVPLRRTIADLFTIEKRGNAMGCFFMGILLGPVVGPVIGGYMNQCKPRNKTIKMATSSLTCSDFP